MRRHRDRDRDRDRDGTHGERIRSNRSNQIPATPPDPHASRPFDHTPIERYYVCIIQTYVRIDFGGKDASSPLPRTLPGESRLCGPVVGMRRGYSLISFLLFLSIPVVPTMLATQTSSSRLASGRISSTFLAAAKFFSTARPAGIAFVRRAFCFMGTMWVWAGEMVGPRGWGRALPFGPSGCFLARHAPRVLAL